MQLNEEALEVLQHHYYPRAKWLQNNCNWNTISYTGSEANAEINDPLMQHCEIYDCFTRNAAGFSNVLQDLKFGSKTPKWHAQDALTRITSEGNDSINWPLQTWLYAFLCHRITGSGASFQDDHGYRNSVVRYWGRLSTIDDMKECLVEAKAKKIAIFTSIGNQPPSPKKGVSNIDFMVKELPMLIVELTEWLQERKRGHKEIVDYLNNYNISNGHRRFNFAYAAFSMDISDYYPELVDEYSHTYLGNNAIRCMKLMSRGYKTDAFMDILTNLTGGKAKDLEDVMCDFVRYGQNYDPFKRGRHFNNSPINFIKKYGWEDRSGTISYAL